MRHNADLLLAAAVTMALIAPAQAGQVLAIENVDLIPMTEEVVFSDQTILIRDGQIEAIGKRGTVETPDDATMIDGTGLYALPGLADMHVHLYLAGAEEELKLYLANGITTIRNLAGSPRHLALIESLESGATTGPRLYTTGPVMNGVPMPRGMGVLVRTEEEARTAVREAAGAGYMAAKFHNFLPPAAFDAVIDEAHKLGIRAGGHVPVQVPLTHALAAGQDYIEHLTGYDPERVDPDLVRLTVESGTWNTPTLAVIWSNAQRAMLLANEPDEIRYVSARELERWRRHRAKALNLAGYQEWVRALHDAGARLMIGTDTNTPYLVPGFATHHELELTVAAGLSPFEALRLATVTPAQFLAMDRLRGTLEEGKQADLLLLAENPLADIRHSRSIEGVIVRGEYFDRETIDNWLEDIARDNSSINTEN